MDRRRFLKLFGVGAGAAAAGLVTTEPRVLSDGQKLYVPPQDLIVPKPNEVIVATRLEDVESVSRGYVDMWIEHIDVTMNTLDVTSLEDSFRKYAPSTINVQVQARLAGMQEVDFASLRNAAFQRKPVRWYLQGDNA